MDSLLFEKNKCQKLNFRSPLQYLGQNSLDSVPNTQVVRVAQRNSDLLNLTKVIPNRIDIVHEWNVGDIPGQFYSNWHKDVKLVAAERPGYPGGEWNTVGTNSQFLDYLSVPAGPAKAGMPFNFVADEDLILAKYHYDPNIPPPSGPDPLNVNNINYGVDNNSGSKLEASWLKAEGNNYLPQGIYPVSPRGVTRTLNVQTDRSECIASDGKVILSSGWMNYQLFLATGARGPTLPRYFSLSDSKLYLDDQLSIDMYNYCLQNHGDARYFLELMGLKATNVDVILELPAGKEPFGIVGQVNKAPKRGGQKPNAQYVKYQNQKTTFTGFGQKLFESKQAGQTH